MTDGIFSELIEAAIDGEPTRVQCDPDERDPVTDETADEAWETFERRGLVNPFHARELQRRQSERRQKGDSRSLMDALEVADSSNRRNRQ